MDIEILQPPINRWNKSWISPGPVGSVGDVLMSVRLKHNCPEAPIRWDPTFSGREEKFYGSNVQDGQKRGFSSAGGPAENMVYNWEVTRPLLTTKGFRYQDVRGPDKSSETIMGPTPKYPWKNQVSQVYKAKSTGNKFLPLPNGYQMKDVPRGGLYPSVVETAAGTRPMRNSFIPQPQTLPGGPSVVEPVKEEQPNITDLFSPAVSGFIPPPSSRGSTTGRRQ